MEGISGGYSEMQRMREEGGAATQALLLTLILGGQDATGLLSSWPINCFNAFDSKRL
jgi:hypothetical protein